MQFSEFYRKDSDVEWNKSILLDSGAELVNDSVIVYSKDKLTESITCNNKFTTYCEKYKTKLSIPIEKINIVEDLGTEIRVSVKTSSEYVKIKINEWIVE